MVVVYVLLLWLFNLRKDKDFLHCFAPILCTCKSLLKTQQLAFFVTWTKVLTTWKVLLTCWCEVVKQPCSLDQSPYFTANDRMWRRLAPPRTKEFFVLVLRFVKCRNSLLAWLWKFSVALFQCSTAPKPLDISSYPSAPLYCDLPGVLILRWHLNHLAIFMFSCSSSFIANVSWQLALCCRHSVAQWCVRAQAKLDWMQGGTELWTAAVIARYCKFLCGLTFPVRQDSDILW